MAVSADAIFNWRQSMLRSSSSELQHGMPWRRNCLSLVIMLVLLAIPTAPAFAHTARSNDASAIEPQPVSSAEEQPSPVLREMYRTARVQYDTPLSSYPTEDLAAAHAQLPAGATVGIAESLTDEVGQQWYRTVDGDYVAASALAFLAPPSAPNITITATTLLPVFAAAEHWIDVSLSPPATLTAYAGGTPVRTMSPIIGRGSTPTPVGDFSIIRRVANETMDSASIGIPRDGPGGYYLTDVLYTQYFLPSGYSIHYNYWSSNWGYPGSHGCLGLSYDDAAFVWDFAGVGTPVSIHY
jgi:lipoprotein-anchoring transpeptidase ErfK/SrfK